MYHVQDFIFILKRGNTDVKQNCNKSFQRTYTHLQVFWVELKKSIKKKKGAILKQQLKKKLVSLSMCTHAGKTFVQISCERGKNKRTSDNISVVDLLFL